MSSTVMFTPSVVIGMQPDTVIAATTTAAEGETSTVQTTLAATYTYTLQNIPSGTTSASLEAALRNITCGGDPDCAVTLSSSTGRRLSKLLPSTVAGRRRLVDSTFTIVRPLTGTEPISMPTVDNTTLAPMLGSSVASAIAVTGTFDSVDALVTYTDVGSSVDADAVATSGSMSPT
eukprot:3597800-Prymnesium_polylepis.1